MIIDAYNTTQNVRTRSDYLTGARPGQPAPPHVPFDPQRILTRMDAAGERHSHIYLETSATLLSDVRRAYARLGPTKILMGSEWPGSDFDLERMKIAKATAVREPWPYPSHRP